MVDRISDLPDELLCHILSFLPTKLAFGTRVLSKRWTQLSHSLPTLSFVDNKVDILNVNPFFTFIDSILTFPRGHHQPIKKFHFMCYSTIWSNNKASLYMDKWFESAKRHSVVDISLSSISPFRILQTIFNCPTLVVLNLRNLCIAACSDVAYLPSLKILRLRDVLFQNYEDVNKLLYCCPILEELHTKGVYYMKTSSLVAPKEGFNTSAKLVKANMTPHDVPVGAISKVDFLYVFFRRFSFLPEHINTYIKSFPVFQNLTNLHLHFLAFAGWKSVLVALHLCPKLQVLYIKKNEKSANNINCDYPNLVPGCLSDHIRTCTIVNYLRCDLPFATYILRNATFLEELQLKTKQRQQLLEEELFSCPRVSPNCTINFI